MELNFEIEELEINITINSREEAEEFTNNGWKNTDSKIDAAGRALRASQNGEYETLVLSGLKGIRLEDEFNKVLSRNERTEMSWNRAFNAFKATVKETFGIPDAPVLRRRVRKAL